MNPHRLKAYGLLTLVALIWGVATPVIKFTFFGIAPLPFLTYRFAISATFAILFFLLTKPNFSQIKNNLLEVLLYSFIVTTVALGILFLGIEKTTVLDAALIAAVAPLVTATVGVIFLKEHITAREKKGMAIAFTGTLITVFEPLLARGFDPSAVRGNLLVFAYIVIMAFAALLSKRLVRKKVDPLTLTNLSFIVGFVTILPIGLFSVGFPQIVGSVVNLAIPYHLGVFYMALISGTAAYAMWVRGQKTIEISEAGLFSYLIPLFAAPLGIIWLKESITTPFIVGAILITTGVITAEYKKRRK